MVFLRSGYLIDLGVFGLEIENGAFTYEWFMREGRGENFAGNVLHRRSLCFNSCALTCGHDLRASNAAVDNGIRCFSIIVMIASDRAQRRSGRGALAHLSNDVGGNRSIDHTILDGPIDVRPEICAQIVPGRAIEDF